MAKDWKAPDGQASARYGNLAPDRQSFLDRAREFAGLTISHLFRPEGENGTTQAEVPWNSGGAYMVSNLASKLIFSIFPPNTPPMKLSPDQKALVDLRAVPDAQQRADLLSGIMKGLTRVESEFVEAFEQDGDRAKLTVGAMKMIVGGTHGFEFKKGGEVRGISLDKFVNKRDLSGNLIEFCVQDWLSWETLDPEVRDKITEMGMEPAYAEDPSSTPKNIAVYTYGKLCTKAPYASPVWDIFQETWGFKVEGSAYVRYPDDMPFLFCPWLLLDEEDYGRSYVEYYEADLQTVEGNTQSVVQGAAALAKIVTLVRPGGYTDKKALAQAENGAVLTGRVEDVGTVQSGKQGDLSVVQNVNQEASQRLARAFLLNSSIQRNGERVTAEEIRFVAQELNDALGGVYSQQAVTFQSPYVRRKLVGLQKAGRVTSLPKGTAKLTLTGGIAALSRNTEMTALQEWAGFMTQVIGPQWQSVLGPKAALEVAKRAAAALRINTDGLIPSEEEAAQLAQANQTQAIMSNPAAVEGIKQFGNNLTANQVADTQAQTKLATTPPPQPQAVA